MLSPAACQTRACSRNGSINTAHVDCATVNKQELSCGANIQERTQAQPHPDRTYPPIDAVHGHQVPRESVNPNTAKHASLKAPMFIDPTALT